MEPVPAAEVCLTRGSGALAQGVAVIPVGAPECPGCPLEALRRPPVALTAPPLTPSLGSWKEMRWDGDGRRRGEAEDGFWTIPVGYAAPMLSLGHPLTCGAWGYLATNHAWL